MDEKRSKISKMTILSRRSLLAMSLVLSLYACKKNTPPANTTDYLNEGKEITKASFTALSNKLSEQMKMGGPKQAIPFCNVEALPLTDSLANAFDVSIKRTSDKLRNPKNQATDRELEIIDAYKKIHSNGAVLKPVVERGSDNKMHFYAPITTSAKCLKCHGKTGEMMDVKTDSIIKSLYPSDMATGYGDEQVRGIWSITFNK